MNITSVVFPNAPPGSVIPICFIRQGVVMRLYVATCRSLFPEFPPSIVEIRVVRGLKHNTRELDDGGRLYIEDRTVGTILWP